MNEISCKFCKYGKAYYHGFQNGKAKFSYECTLKWKHLSNKEWNKGCEKSTK